MSMLKRPAVTPFVECPNCKRLLEYGVERCPSCREEIGADYALVSVAVVHLNTQACASANTIKSGDLGAVITLLTAAYGYFLGYPSLFVVSFVTPVVALLVILVWFYRFGRFNIGDEEYMRARREMRWSLKLWVALLGVQLLALIYMLKS